MDRTAARLPSLREVERFLETALEGGERDLLAGLPPLRDEFQALVAKFVDAGPAAEVADRVYELLPQLSEQLSADAHAIYEGDPAAESVAEVKVAYPGFLAITVHRLAHAVHGLAVPILPRLLSEVAHARTGIDIHPGARIGRSFCIDHGTGIVIGETAVIGDKVKIYQGVTLGALSVQRHRVAGRTGRANKRHPTIGDRVTIYSGANILGGNTVIGSGSIIGGNAWIVESVPENSKVFGREREAQPDSEQPLGSDGSGAALP